MQPIFTVTEANLAAGFCLVSTSGPDGVAHELTIPIASIAINSNDTELMLQHTISQLVLRELEILYPAPLPQPAALEQMVGKTYGN